MERIKATGKEQKIPRLTDFLPTTKKELELRGWSECDVILFSADAYVDHPSFGAAVIGRLLESFGLRIAIVPQPDWHGDLRDFKKLGCPRLFFGIAPGAMDSMVNKYTANRRLRSEDAYSPNGRHDLRPEMPTIVYTQCIRQVYPDVPIVLGGIEASLRRLTHYDYWKDKLRPSILYESQADLLIYGMGELPIEALCNQLLSFLKDNPETPRINRDHFFHLLQASPIQQTVQLFKESEIPGGFSDEDIILHSHEECLHSHEAEAENFKHIEEESNRLTPQRLLQKVNDTWVVVNPTFPPMDTKTIDRSFDLPYTRLPHPKYQGKRIPAYEMIKFSINLHRGCFGGCAFCTISAHQGKFVCSRSESSILHEVEKITHMPDFHGTISDLGGPSANMYNMSGRNKNLCQKCKRPSCIFPKVCPNLNTNHEALLKLYAKVDATPLVKHSYIGSGVRYDLLLHESDDALINKNNYRYIQELITKHTCGRLKVAPEHTSDKVLNLMRKPSFHLFYKFKRIFENINKQNGLRQQIIPYFISSHPGCEEEDMAELAVETKKMDFHLEQVQDFTPTPMTVSTETWYTGLHPYTLKPIFSARDANEKLRQRMFFFWYKPEERVKIERELRKLGRTDLLTKLYGDSRPIKTNNSSRHKNNKEQESSFQKQKHHTKYKKRN